MRIVWLGNRDERTFRETVRSIVGDRRVEEMVDRPLGAPSESLADEIATADGVVLAVHHFEPLTSAWLSRLNQSLDANRWRAALGPFAAVAARAPFDVLHRQGFLTETGPFAIERWLDRLSGERTGYRTPRNPQRVLLWEPTGERSGIDPSIFVSASLASLASAKDVARITPRTFGLPFAPDVTVAWITADLNREERVHLGQLRSATPGSARVAAYATPAAAARFPLKVDAKLVWPYGVEDLLLAVAASWAERAGAADRAA